MINKFNILNGAKYFPSGLFQNYFVFIPPKKFIKYFSGTTQIDSLRSNETWEENIENTTKSDSNFAASFVDNHVLWDINFNGRSLINIYIPEKVISIYLLCNKSILKKLRDFALDNRLFGSVKLTKTTDQDKYKYSSYRRGFDSDSKFSFTDGNMVKNVIILGADRSLSVS